MVEHVIGCGHVSGLDVQGVFRMTSDEAEAVTIGRIEAARGLKVIAGQSEVYAASYMLFSGSRGSPPLTFGSSLPTSASSPAASQDIATQLRVYSQPLRADQSFWAVSPPT